MELVEPGELASEPVAAASVLAFSALQAVDVRLGRRSGFRP
ncbi:hypothetical protein [Streptomyces botrytidirepellens]|nr:hypothetical protein [Streptomyces botrytidirepellens]